MSDRLWLTTHMMTGPQSQVAAVSAYASPGRTGMIQLHSEVKPILNLAKPAGYPESG